MFITIGYEKLCIMAHEAGSVPFFARCNARACVLVYIIHTIELKYPLRKSMEKASVSDDSPDSSTDCDWSELQADLLLQIFGTLEIPDLFSSGAVCRSWHLIYLEARRLRRCSPNQSPCLVYSSGDCDANTATLHNMSTNKLYHVTLSEPAFRTRYVMGSSYGWLITADDRSNLILVNPATGAQIAMPPPQTMNNVTALH